MRIRYTVKSKKEIDAKAVYLTGWTAGTLSKRASVIEDINKLLSEQED